MLLPENFGGGGAVAPRPPGTALGHVGTLESLIGAASQIPDGAGALTLSSPEYWPTFSEAYMAYLHLVALHVSTLDGDSIVSLKTYKQ